VKRRKDEKASPRFSVSPFLRFLPVLLAVPALFTGLGSPAFMDHEGRYAEVAREMLLTGDWVTPRLNFAVFLNKPPLPYWLTALTFALTGQTEYVRVWTAIVGFLLILVTVELGRTLADQRSGLLAGVVLLTSGGFFLESRLLRPDLLMTLCLSVTLLGFVKACKILLSQAKRADTGTQPNAPESTSSRSAATWWLVLSAASLGVSILTKGMVDVVLASGVIGGMLVCSRQWALLRQVRWLPIFLVLFVIVLPWHVLAGMRNEGFWWDYVVNQHVLFFFDKKFPRDSLPDALTVFWGAFLGRTLPWGVVLPCALYWASKKSWAERTSTLTLLPWWLGIVLGFFSLSPARLEHYSLPALPAVALLVGCWWSDILERGVFRAPAALASLGCLGLLGLVGFVTAPAVLDAETWTQEFPLLSWLARLVCGVLVVTASIAAVCVWHKALRTAFVVFACSAVPLLWSVQQALLVIEPRNSWKSIGIRLAEVLPPDGEAAFAASDEYQICGGLNFYSGKSLSIVLPEGYMPPTYLALDRQTNFLTHTEFLQRWQGKRPIVLVIDPERQLVDPQPVISESAVEIGRWGERIMLVNRAFAERAIPMADSKNDHDFLNP
jgi:4-amino-4-deoxy-L-arabinose transferase-like glycosyltransferase